MDGMALHAMDGRAASSSHLSPEEKKARKVSLMAADDLNEATRERLACGVACVCTVDDKIVACGDSSILEECPTLRYLAELMVRP